MSRRRLLGAVFAAPAAVALPAVAAPSPDAALLADCARCLVLMDTAQDARWSGGPLSVAALEQVEDDEAEAFELFEAIRDARPATMAGVAAQARVTLRQALDMGETGCSDDPGGACEDAIVQLAAGDPAFDARFEYVRGERERRRNEARARRDRANAEKEAAEEAAKLAQRTRLRPADELRDMEDKHRTYMGYLRDLTAHGEAEAAEVSRRLALAISTGQPA